MARRYFTVSEVEQLIPDLERIFVKALQLVTGLRALEQKLERAGIKVTREEVLESKAGSPSVRRAKFFFQGYYQLLGDELARIRALGGEVRDIENGLVEFAGLRKNEEILFCWKPGEKKIGYWRPKDAGPAVRRPLDDEIPREPGLSREGA